MYSDFKADEKNAKFLAEKVVLMKNFSSKNQLIVLYGNSTEFFPMIQDKIYEITNKKENQKSYNLLIAGMNAMSTLLTPLDSKFKVFPENLEIHFNPTGYIIGFKLLYGNFYILNIDTLGLENITSFEAFKNFFGDSEAHEKYFLNKLKDFESKKKESKVEEWKEFTRLLNLLEFNPKEHEFIFNILATVLHLNQLELKENEDWKLQNKESLDCISKLLSVKNLENIIINQEEALEDGIIRIIKLKKFLYEKLLKYILGKVNTIMFTKEPVKNIITLLNVPIPKSENKFIQKLKEFKYQNFYSLYEKEFLSGNKQNYYNLDIKDFEFDDVNFLNYSKDNILQNFMSKSTNNIIRNLFFSFNTKTISKEVREKVEDMIFAFGDTEKNFLLESELIKNPKYKYQNKIDENVFEKRYVFGKESMDDVLDEMKEFDDHGKFIFISNEEMIKLEEKRKKKFKPFANMFESALKGYYIRKLTLNYQIFRSICLMIKRNWDDYQKMKNNLWYQAIQKVRWIDFDKLNKESFMKEKEKLLNELEELKLSRKQSLYEKESLKKDIESKKTESSMNDNEIQVMEDLKLKVSLNEQNVQSLKDMLDSTNKSIEDYKKMNEKRANELKLVQNKIDIDQQEKKKIEVEIEKLKIILFLQEQLKAVEKSKDKKTEK